MNIHHIIVTVTQVAIAALQLAWPGAAAGLCHRMPQSPSCIRKVGEVSCPKTQWQHAPVSARTNPPTCGSMDTRLNQWATVCLMYLFWTLLNTYGTHVILYTQTNFTERRNIQGEHQYKENIETSLRLILPRVKLRLQTFLLYTTKPDLA